MADEAPQPITVTANAEAAITDDKTNKPKAVASKPSAETSSIDNIVTEWTQRADKPYLKESITIMQVAEQMGLNTRLLSNYLNSVKGRNFNA